MTPQKTAWSKFPQFRFGSLLLRNFALNLLLVMLPLLLIIWLGFTNLQDEMNIRLMRMNDDLLNKSAMVTDNLMNSIEELVTQASRKQGVRQALQTSADDPDYDAIIATAISEVESYTANSPYIVSFTLYSSISDVFIDSYSRLPIPAASYRSKEAWYYIDQVLPMTNVYALTSDDNMVQFCAPIYAGNGTRTGLLVFDVFLQNIRMLLESEEALTHGLFFILDNAQQIIYCSQLNYWQMSPAQQQAYRNAILYVHPGETEIVSTDELRIISVAGSSHHSWSYAFITTQPLYRQETSVLQSYLLTAVIVGGLVCLLSSYFITRFSYRPIRKIIDVIENPSISASVSEPRESREMRYITSHILSSLSSKSQADKELAERLQALRKAQALALQFQINPHFLYNTMEVINWSVIAEIGFNNRTSTLVTNVAKLYRLCLDEENMILSLRQEMDFVRLYLDILNARFGSRIQVEWDIPEELLQCSLLRMCMQPLVENAVNYAMKPKNYNGTICIRAWRDREHLCVAVEDDGPGISYARLKEINTKLQSQDKHGSSHIGLQNVNERVKLIYGNEYGVTLQNAAGSGKQGTQAIITFPYTQIKQESEGTNE